MRANSVGIVPVNELFAFRVVTHAAKVKVWTKDATRPRKKVRVRVSV
jgi:hypothetical protein